LKFFLLSFLLIIQITTEAVLRAETTRRSTIPRNAAPGVGYVGSAACAGCHVSLYEGYRKTGMGRSMSLASDPSQLSRLPAPVTVLQQNLKRHYTAFRQGLDLYQSQYGLDESGKEIFRSTHKLEYVIGSGANGQSYVVRRGDALFQAPLSYYSKPAKWDLSPGFELQDAAFNRPIQAGCVTCHSGRANVMRDRPAVYAEPAFHELAIGCENCHGPGQLHVAERSTGAPPPKSGDSSIVNPSRLPSWLADNICMNCHQTGDTRVLQPGKDHLDFRPGTALNETVGIFRTPYQRESPPNDDLLQHYASMALSRCYQQSQGRLSCISCHSPHTEPSAQEAPAYYRAKCLGCHGEKSCSIPLTQRLEQRPANDCASCHLPKRNLKTIAHSALTNHRILARPDERLPDAAFQAAEALAGVVHVNAAPGREKDPIPLLTQLQVYGELLALRPGYQQPYLAVLDQLSKSQPEHPLVLSALARKAKLEGTPQGTALAIEYLSRAVKLGSTSVVDYQDLSGLLGQAQRNDDAVQVLKKGIELFPFHGLFHKALALQYIGLKNYPKALEAMKQHLALFPEDSFMRNLIQQAERAKPD
jgi:Doubled CXXCH motif (Paired_CXXCH_1)/Cytochrome c554 and c-prime